MVQFRDRQHTPCCTLRRSYLCPFSPLERFTVKRCCTSYSRTSATRRIVNKNSPSASATRMQALQKSSSYLFPRRDFLESPCVGKPRSSRRRTSADHPRPIDSRDAFIHSIFAETLYTSNMDVGCSQWGIFASTMTPQHHTGSAIPQFS